MSVELGNNCHCSLNAITPTGTSSSSSFRGRETVLVFSYKALFKAELLCVNTDTTRGIKYCTGCAKDGKRSPSVHRSWYWFWCSAHILVVSLCSKIMYTMSTKNMTKHSAFQKLPWKIPHVGKEERAQTVHIQMSMWANAMKMFLSGTDRQEAWRGTGCSEKWWEKAQHQVDHSRPAWPAPSSKVEILCKKELQTDRAFDNLSAPQ